jgi:hypothetical protein
MLWRSISLREGSDGGRWWQSFVRPSVARRPPLTTTCWVGSITHRSGRFARAIANYLEPLLHAPVTAVCSTRGTFFCGNTFFGDLFSGRGSATVVRVRARGLPGRALETST